jgi:hypothetical protein
MSWTDEADLLDLCDRANNSGALLYRASIVNNGAPSPGASSDEDQKTVIPSFEYQDEPSKDQLRAQLQLSEELL